MLGESASTQLLDESWKWKVSTCASAGKPSLLKFKVKLIEVVLLSAWRYFPLTMIDVVTATVHSKLDVEDLPVELICKVTQSLEIPCPLVPHETSIPFWYGAWFRGAKFV